MQDDNLAGCVSLVLILSAFFISGTITYNIVEPQSFIGILIFLVIWPIVGLLGLFLIEMIFKAIFVSKK